MTITKLIPSRLSTLFLAAALGVVGGCDSSDPAEPAAADKKSDDKKSDDKKSDADKAAADKAAADKAAADKAAADKAAVAPAADAAAGSGDYFEIIASHAEAKPTDPVTLKVGIKATAAKFDPKNPEGGTATVELDVTTLESGNGGRDGHLKSGDYLNAAANPAITVDVSEVKKADDAGKAFTATANVMVKGQAVKWPLKFEIVESTDDSIRVRGTHSFDRTAIGIGNKAAEGNSVADTIEARFQLTLKNAG